MLKKKLNFRLKSSHCICASLCTFRFHFLFVWRFVPAYKMCFVFCVVSVFTESDFYEISMLSEMKENLKAIIRYSHFSLLPMLSNPMLSSNSTAHCTLYTVQHTIHCMSGLLQHYFYSRINEFSIAENHISC